MTRSTRVRAMRREWRARDLRRRTRAVPPQITAFPLIGETPQQAQATPRRAEGATVPSNDGGLLVGLAALSD
jgi:hypothetical protein